jgi:alkylation response protein AidB-like acyl-CoA dehydrogenase
MTATPTTSLVKGGEFLIKPSRPEDIFTPEDYTEEQLMLRRSMRDFLDKEVEPIKEKFDSVEGTTLAPVLLEKMGALGFHGIGVPESYGEIASDSFAFAQSIGVHTGLGIYPVLHYGTPEQQARYLPGIIAGRIKCCYCLTEPGSGSDANAARTRAVPSADGTHYVLNGQKMWITNSGFADVFFVFCKIGDDRNLSCLIVHKEHGVKLGAEERKLGIHGSSTRQVFFEDVKVPVENLLGERDKGFKIAMNALNAGRIKIAVANSANAKRAFGLAVRHANQRVQFGRPIAGFGAIQRKIATMATRIHANDSAWNRVAHQVDQVRQHMLAGGMPELEAKQRSVAEFALECAMTKVYGSEMEQLVVDEALQIHGGMGYSAECEISTLYRNIRGNRIYEGTNEINRLLIPTTLLRKAMKGEVALMPAAMQAFQDLQGGGLTPATGNGEPFGLELDFLALAKQVTILAAGQAMQRFQEAIQDEQEVLMELADMLTQVFMFESALLRTIKHRNRPHADVARAMVTVLMHDTAEVLRRAVREVVYASAQGDMAGTTVKALIRLLNLPPHDLKETRRRIAAHFIARNGYEL